jgi:hypothetical protein
MNKSNVFILIEILIIIGTAIAVFRGVKSFFQSVYSTVFRSYYLWSKKLWDKHFERSFKFETFLLISALLTGINILVFKYLIK